MSYGKKRAFVVTDSFLYMNGYTKPITDKLDEMGIVYTVLLQCTAGPDPGKCAWKVPKAMTAFQPDVIIALGGGSAMDAGKIMWVMYEHPEVDFQGMAMRFIDIRKTCLYLPEDGRKSLFCGNPDLFRYWFRSNSVCGYHRSGDRCEVSVSRLSAASEHVHRRY